jgi:hypothetical protein
MYSGKSFQRIMELTNGIISAAGNIYRNNNGSIL